MVTRLDPEIRRLARTLTVGARLLGAGKDPDDDH
jgi:hypothetical protein